jgi:hypothetical protein
MPLSGLKGKAGYADCFLMRPCAISLNQGAPGDNTIGTAKLEAAVNYGGD